MSCRTPTVAQQGNLTWVGPKRRLSSELLKLSTGLRSYLDCGHWPGCATCEHEVRAGENRRALRPAGAIWDRLVAQRWGHINQIRAFAAAQHTMGPVCQARA